MTIERIRADLAAAVASDEHHRAKVLTYVLSAIDAEAARHGRAVPSEADAQAGLRTALVAAERQEDRLEAAHRLAAAEISERDVLLLAGYLDAET